MPDVSAVLGPRLIGLVEAAFSPGGPLAASLAAFEPREGQRRMAAAVADVLERGGTLLAEAGTGTGKTLAYLVPAILSRQRVVVSTGTRNLQEQIFSKDLPLLRDALGVPFSAACMKGRANYLCLHRFGIFRQGPPLRSNADRIHLALIEAWADKTETGDRAEIDELPDEVPIWNEIAATAEHCLGATCPQFDACFVTRMRQRAAESDVVIVNHHLLCADSSVRHQSFGEVVPEAPALVVDEAHQLEDVATQYFGYSVSNYRIEDLVRDGTRAASELDGASHDARQATKDALASVETHAKVFFAALQWRPADPVDRIRGANGWFDERIRLTPDRIAPFEAAGLDLALALDGLEATVALVKDAPEDLRSVGRRAAEIATQLRFILTAADRDYVYFLETRGRGIFLKCTPIDVSGLVRELVLERFRTRVLTSATLSVGGSFAHVRARLGVDEATELTLPPEFDYSRQAVLYLPRRMPDPRSEGFNERAVEETVALLRRTEGRAFVLFTSYAALRFARERIASAVPYPLLVQGEAPRSRLIELFRTTPNAVLLATSSFWQGVDVAGEALSCVIIDRLPFASPGDPITAARVEAIAARGGRAFDDYQVPAAILTLLQGIGRLIRTRTDRGVLAILDPRIRTMGYGRRFLGAMPPAPVTYDLDAVERFVAAGPDATLESDAR